MNAPDVINFGHRTVLDTVERVPEQYWEEGGVCGIWSVKDILAHLACYEWLAGDILLSVLGEGPTPHLDQLFEQGDAFNDRQVEVRQSLTASETMAEYIDAYDRLVDLTARTPAEMWRTVGTVPWYGAEYSLDDLVVYQYYGHKREHSAQIAVFSDRLALTAPA